MSTGMIGHPMYVHTVPCRVRVFTFRGRQPTVLWEGKLLANHLLTPPWTFEADGMHLWAGSIECGVISGQEGTRLEITIGDEVTTYEWSQGWQIVEGGDR